MSYSHVIMKSCSRDIQISCPLVFMHRFACSVVNIDELLHPSASHYLGSLDLSLACSWTLSLALLLFYYLPLPLCNFVPLRQWPHGIRFSKSCSYVLVLSFAHTILISCWHGIMLVCSHALIPAVSLCSCTFLLPRPHARMLPITFSHLRAKRRSLIVSLPVP